MRWNGIVRSIGFAAVAAALAPLCWHLLGIPTGLSALGPFVAHLPSQSNATALAWVWTLLVAVYAYGLAPGRGEVRRHRALGAALGLIVVGATARAVGFTPTGVLALVALGLSAARISWHPANAGLRRWAAEAGLGLGSVFFACWQMQVFVHGPLAFAAGVWAFFLVQSLAFAAAPVASRSDRAGDAFELAQRRLESLLTDGRS